MTNVDFARYKRIVQYFWDPEPKNDDVSKAPIWCLGLQYAADPTPSPSTKSACAGDAHPDNGAFSSTVNGGRPDDALSNLSDKDVAKDDSTGDTHTLGAWPTSFLDDFESKVWLTYRSNFPPISRSSRSDVPTASFSARLRSQLVDQAGFTTDTGWGCMIRSGQSLLANALVLLKLGRGWRRGAKAVEERDLLSLFADDPEAPFSIHRFVRLGASACGKQPGEWFGPSAAARCIQVLTDEYRRTGMNVYMTGDGSDVYEDSFMEVARGEEGQVFQPTLVLVGIRLGIDRVTPVYWDSLKISLQLPQSVGIAGGRPSSSHYFVGVQGHHFFYLDPHHTRPALPLHGRPESYSAEDIDSCHTRRLRRLHIKDMDPSMLIAFLIRDEDDWRLWRRSVSQVSGKAIINVADKAPSLHGHGSEREGAIEEVEAFDDDDDDDDGVVIVDDSNMTGVSAVWLAWMYQHIWVAFQRLRNGRNVFHVSIDKIDVAQD